VRGVPVRPVAKRSWSMAVLSVRSRRRAVRSVAVAVCPLVCAGAVGWLVALELMI
jgi:hypothetical protein